ncbi:MAG: hypothetical protein ABIP53_10225 [Candidatus Limnocylindrales bacterium]
MPGASYTLTVSTNGWLPTTVLWDTGQTTPSTTFTAGPSGTVNHSATVRNPIDGTTIAAQRPVAVGPSHKRVLYSDPSIVRYPPYPFKGGVYDVKVNGGVVMPVGCAVLSAVGQRLDYDRGAYHLWGPPLSSLSLTTHGYSMVRPGGIGARNLDVDARVWPNGTHAIRVKVHYLIAEPDGVDCKMSGATVHGWYPGPARPPPVPTEKSVPYANRQIPTRRVTQESTMTSWPTACSTSWPSIRPGTCRSVTRTASWVPNGFRPARIWEITIFHGSPRMEDVPSLIKA